MLKKNVWMILALFLVFLPTLLPAQEMMHGKWWQNKAMVEQLALTDSEKKILDEKYTESRRKMVDLKSEVERERLELDILLDSQDAKKEQIAERYDSLEKARAKLSKERFGLLMEVRDIVGVDRFQELKSMYRDRDRDRTRKRFSDRD
jgi:hypothetical protein